MNRRGVLLQQLDVMDVVNFLDKKNRQFQATLLSQLEEIYPKDEKYAQARKLILDSTNNFNRLVVKTIFGDIESG